LNTSAFFFLVKEMGSLWPYHPEHAQSHMTEMGKSKNIEILTLVL
jgi:hypothetical protein